MTTAPSRVHDPAEVQHHHLDTISLFQFLEVEPQM